MPFQSAKQEIAMMINSPDVWRKWVSKYGHHPGFKAAIAKSNKKRSKSKSRTGKRKG